MNLADVCAGHLRSQTLTLSLFVEKTT